MTVLCCSGEEAWEKMEYLRDYRKKIDNRKNEKYTE
jgi:hypothetical protein